MKMKVTIFLQLLLVTSVFTEPLNGASDANSPLKTNYNSDSVMDDSCNLLIGFLVALILVFLSFQLPFRNIIVNFFDLEALRQQGPDGHVDVTHWTTGQTKFVLLRIAADPPVGSDYETGDENYESSNYDSAEDDEREASTI